MDPLSQIGVGGVFAIFIIREFVNILGVLNKRKNGNGNINGTSDSKKLDDLWEWHKPADEDGVKVWYNRRSLEATIREISENIKAQTQVLQQIVKAQDDMKDEINRLDADLANKADNKDV